MADCAAMVTQKTPFPLRSRLITDSPEEKIAWFKATTGVVSGEVSQIFPITGDVAYHHATRHTSNISVSYVD